MVILIIAGLVLFTAILTNPSEAKQKEILKSKLTQLSIDGGLNENLIALASSFIANLVDNTISSDNYVLFSVVKSSWENQTNVIGIGVFGNVILFSGDQFKSLSNN